MYYDLIIAGFGGQGVMFIGNLLAEAAMLEERYVTYMPVYGVEMRGGTANCTVVVSDEPIGSPVIKHPQAAVVMNRPSLAKFGPLVKPGGLLMINASLVEAAEAEGLVGPRIVFVPATKIASQAGGAQLSNMALLGAFMRGSGLVGPQSLARALEEGLGQAKKDLVELNMRVIEAGARFMDEAAGA